MKRLSDSFYSSLRNLFKSVSDFEGRSKVPFSYNSMGVTVEGFAHDERPGRAETDREPTNPLWCYHWSLVPVWCFAGASLVLLWCYCGASLALWCSLVWCQSGATLVPVWCYSGASLVLLWCQSGGRCQSGATRLVVGARLVRGLDHRSLRSFISLLFSLSQIDRIFLELHKDPEETYLIFRKCVEQVNVIVESFAATPEIAEAFQVSVGSGSVGFGSGLQTFGFTIDTFARIYAKKFDVKREFVWPTMCLV
jgi:hypothetical protein